MNTVAKDLFDELDRLKYNIDKTIHGANNLQADEANSRMFRANKSS